MKIEFEIPIQKLFSECIHQSMVDAQGVVTESGQSMVGEVALSEKNREIFEIELASQVSRLYTAFTDLLQCKESNDSGLVFSVATPDIDSPSFAQAVAIAVKDYLKYAMLVWWNLSRGNTMLLTAYSARQDEVRSNILHLITPQEVRPYRYW